MTNAMAAWRSLRRRGKRYNRRAGKNAGRGLIPNRIDISERPAIVARKTRLGDWEGDTVVSAGRQPRRDQLFGGIT
jgi:transposase, IS30 family